MPFKHHDVFTSAPSPEARLWRYMSLAKFLSLVHNSELFFSSLELLARSDPFEGTLPPSSFIHRQWASRHDAPEDIQSRLLGFLRRGETSLDIAFKSFKELRELRIRQAFAHRRSYFLSCWHMSEHESAAMWELYSKNAEGIAVVSSEQRIRSAFKESNPDIYGGQVSYADFDTEKFVMQEHNSFIPVLHKRMSFEHEKEYRLVHWDTEVTHKFIEPKDGYYEWDGKRFPNITGSMRTRVGRSEEEIEGIAPQLGHAIKCNLMELIEVVLVSPLSPPWFIETVQLAARAAGVTAPIKESGLLAEPMR